MKNRYIVGLSLIIFYVWGIVVSAGMYYLCKLVSIVI